MITYSRGVTMVLNRARKNGFTTAIHTGQGEIERTIKLTTRYRSDTGVWIPGTNGKTMVAVDSIAVHLERDGLRQVGVWCADDYLLGFTWVPCTDPTCDRAGTQHPDDIPFRCTATVLGTSVDVIELRAQARELEEAA